MARATAPEATSATRATMASVDSIGRPPEVGRGLAPAADALALAVAGGTLEAAWMGTAAFGDALAEAPALTVLLALDDAVAVADALADDPCAWATLANNNTRATAHAAHTRVAIHFRCSRTGKYLHHCSSALAMHPTSQPFVFCCFPEIRKDTLFLLPVDSRGPRLFSRRWLSKARGERYGTGRDRMPRTTTSYLQGLLLFDELCAASHDLALRVDVAFVSALSAVDPVPRIPVVHVDQIPARITLDRDRRCWPLRGRRP
jgi:hypothetical protein